MVVTVTGSKVRKIWNTGGRDFRPRHLCGARCSLADARLGLLAHQVGVRAVVGNQLSVSPGLHCPAFVEDQDSIGVDDAGKTVSDDQRRSVLHQPVECSLDNGLVVGIHAGERLIQQQNRGIL